MVVYLTQSGVSLLKKLFIGEDITRYNLITVRGRNTEYIYVYYIPSGVG